MRSKIRYVFGTILLIFIINCKEKKEERMTQNKKDVLSKSEKKSTEISFDAYQSISNKNYETWYFSSKNKSNKYKNLKILISKDSIKILTTDTKKIICEGEIIQTKKSISEYMHGQKSADNLKSELNNLFNYEISDSINVIENADSEISKKGCLFPFYEMFFIENELFIYDNEYLIFTNS